MGRTERLAQPVEFGKYQLVARLATGPMADVYKAKSHGVEGFEKILCVKIIHPGHAAKPAFIDALIDEAKRSVALSHANIAQVLDLGQVEAQQKYYVAMEFVAGFDLARALGHARRFNTPWSQAISVFIASEVAKGLDYAHRRKDFNFNNLNILHRALRPENIMLSFDGEVKITDFGLSRAMETAPILDDDDLINRHLYMPPEVAQGHPYTLQSDIFSLGLVLYELLAGFHPYRHDDPEETLRRSRQGIIAPIGDTVELPRALHQIIESMLVADPAGRAQSAGQLYEELIGFIFGNALQADNRLLAMTMQELRRREQNSNESEPAHEVGLEEISHHELESAFSTGGAFYAPDDQARAQPSALPSSQLGSRGSDSGRDRALPGALENLYQSAVQGRGKAVLLSGRMGRGRKALTDRLVEAVDRRQADSSVLISTSEDDRFRPFGALSDLVLRGVQQTLVRSADRYEQALAMLKRWGVSEPALLTIKAIWHLDRSVRFQEATRTSHLVEIFSAMLAKLSEDSRPFVLVIDRVERLDQESLAVLRELIAAIGDLPVLMVLGTQTEDALRAIFDAGRPRDLEAIRVSGKEPPTPESLQDLSPLADRLLTLLALAGRPMKIDEVTDLLEAPAQPIQDAAEALIERGAIRVPRPDRLHADVPNWLTWRRNQGMDDAAPALALARHLVHGVPRQQLAHLTPTLVRLYATGGDRRRLLSLARQYGEGLQRHGWSQTAFHYFQHLSELVGAYRLGVPQKRVDFVLEAAELALEMAHLDACRALLKPLSALTETTRDESGFARSQLLLGALAMQQDDLDEARVHFQRAMQTASGTQSPELFARSTLALAGWYERFGDPAAALDRLEGALNLYNRLDTRRVDLKTRALLLQRTAKMWSDRGMLARAQGPVHALETLARAVPYPSIRCRAFLAAGRLAAHHGAYNRATSDFDAALDAAQGQSLTALCIEVLREQTSLCVRFERFDEAIRWAEQVLGFAEAHGDYYSEQRARDLRAIALASLGRDREAAIAQLRSSLRRATERGVPKDVFRGHDFMARALSAMGHDTEASHHRHHADALGHTMRISWAALSPDSSVVA